MAEKPLVTVITAVYNGLPHLEQTIQSVLNQTYQPIEHVLIDGGSTDGTLNLLQQYGNKIRWVSEKDKGIGDAFNKGVKAAQGEYLIFLGAGDYFVANNVVEQMILPLGAARPLLVCGKIQRVDESNHVLWIAPKKFTPRFNKLRLLFRMPLPHQGLFTHRKFFETYGLFSQDFQFSMDYELLLRAYASFPDVVLRNVMVSAWRAGGVGKGRTLEILKEYNVIKVKNLRLPSFVFVLINAWSHLKYFIKRPLP